MRDSIDDHVELWSRELPWLDPLKEAIVGRMNLLIRYTNSNRAAALRTDGLAMWQYKTLFMLRRQGAPYEASPSELADILGLTRGALSARLATLEEIGLVTRTHSTHDRRRVTVRLTDTGHKALESTVVKEEEGEVRMLSVLSEREKQTLADLLRKLVVGIETSS